MKTSKTITENIPFARIPVIRLPVNIIPNAAAAITIGRNDKENDAGTNLYDKKNRRKVSIDTRITQAAAAPKIPYIFRNHHKQHK